MLSSAFAIVVDRRFDTYNTRIQFHVEQVHCSVVFWLVSCLKFSTANDERRVLDCHHSHDDRLNYSVPPIPLTVFMIKVFGRFGEDP